jgi:hypothetical protein
MSRRETITAWCFTLHADQSYEYNNDDSSASHTRKCITTGTHNNPENIKLRHEEAKVQRDVVEQRHFIEATYASDL